MAKFRIITALLSLWSLYAVAQDSVANLKQSKKQFLFYKSIYAAADSVSAIKEPKLLDEKVFTLADSLDKTGPTSYFMKVGQLLGEHKFNDASFIFYLGKLRFRYYNSADPDYEPSGGGALLASFDQEFGEPLSMYLDVNINNYIVILKADSKWVSDHDYAYFSKTKNPQKYADQINGIKSLVAELENNKEKHTKQWADDRTNFEKLIDETLKEIDEKLKGNK